MSTGDPPDSLLVHPRLPGYVREGAAQGDLLHLINQLLGHLVVIGHVRERLLGDGAAFLATPSFPIQGDGHHLPVGENVDVDLTPRPMGVELGIVALSAPCRLGIRFRQDGVLLRLLLEGKQLQVRPI